MKGSLLIVDDELEIRSLLERHFRLCGYIVKVAGSGSEALSILEKERFDLVISDIMMPVMNGVELLREIKSQYPMIQVIMITGHVTLDNALACMRNDASTCIFKPLNDLTELENAVEYSMEHLRHWRGILHHLQGMKP